MLPPRQKEQREREKRKKNLAPPLLLSLSPSFFLFSFLLTSIEEKGASRLFCFRSNEPISPSRKPIHLSVEKPPLKKSAFFLFPLLVTSFSSARSSVSCFCFFFSPSLSFWVPTFAARATTPVSRKRRRGLWNKLRGSGELGEGGWFSLLMGLDVRAAVWRLVQCTVM